MRSKTTLFLLSSLDGKISTGPNQEQDFDKDLLNIQGVSEGLYQYYAAEQETDLHTLSSGAIVSKMYNLYKDKDLTKIDGVTIIVLDNNHIQGSEGQSILSWLCSRYSRVIIATTNRYHIVWNSTEAEGVFYSTLTDLFEKLYEQFDCESLTIQTGGTLNAALLDEGLIDRVNLFIAPCLVGGKNTPSLIDGDDRSFKFLTSHRVRALELTNVKALNNSYVQLEYTVNNDISTTEAEQILSDSVTKF